MQNDSKFARIVLAPFLLRLSQLNFLYNTERKTEDRMLKYWDRAGGWEMSADVLSGGRAGETEHQERVDWGYCHQSRPVTARLVLHRQRGCGPRSDSHTPPEGSPTCRWWGVRMLLIRITISSRQTRRQEFLSSQSYTCLDFPLGLQTGINLFHFNWPLLGRRRRVKNFRYCSN